MWVRKRRRQRGGGGWVVQEHQMSLNVLQANWSLTWALFLEPQPPFSKGMFAYYWLQIKLEWMRVSPQPEPTSGLRHGYCLPNIYILGKMPATWSLPCLRATWLHLSICCRSHVNLWTYITYVFVWLFTNLWSISLHLDFSLQSVVTLLFL